MTLNRIEGYIDRAKGRRYEEDYYTLGDHYKVWRGVFVFEDGSVDRRFGVDKVNKRDQFIPQIYYNNDGKPEFMIQTISYGIFTAEDAEKMIAGYQEAIEAVKILNMNFC